MDGQGNLSDMMTGQDLHASVPAIQQKPPGANALPPPPPPPPPPHSHPVLFSRQQSVPQQGHPHFHPPPGASAYMHALPSFPHQGPPGPSASSGMISAQVSRTSDHGGSWSVLPMPSPQGHTLEKGQSNQLPLHAPPLRPPPLPHYSSSSSSLLSDPFGFSGNWKNSFPQRVGPLPPPPLPPPPSLPSSDVSYKKDGSHSSKDLSDGDNLMIERPPQSEHDEDKIVRQRRVTCQNPENVEPKMESVGVVVDHSPACSDMEMEDDITHPDEEIKDFLSSKLDGGFTSISQDFVKEQVQASEHTGEHRASKEKFLFAESTVFKDQRGGPDGVSHSDADEPGMKTYGKTEPALEARVDDSSSQRKNSGQSNVSVVCEETGNGRLSGQLVEAANSFNLLHGYASDNTPEHEDENLLEVVTFPNRKGGPPNSNACEGHKFESKAEAKSLSGPNERMPLKSVIEPTRNVMEADKLSCPTGVLEFSYKNYGDREPLMTSTTHESRDRLRSHDASSSPHGPKNEKRGMKSNFTEKVDEFGRLVREGVSDSDTSGSPHYSRRHARRVRRRSSSRSRSRSPHDRRRRSPWRRKRRRDRSLSVSPRRRRSRSRSPVSRRGTELSGDKHRREKTTQLPEKCFDFLRGRCYRGATCRFSHSEANKNERSRNNRDKDLHDKDDNIRQDVPGLRKDRDAKEPQQPLVESNTRSPDKINNFVPGSLSVVDVVASNLPGYSAHDLSSGNPQAVDLKDKKIGDFLVSESSSLLQASPGHIPADKSDANKGLISQPLSIENPLIKTFSTEVQSQSLTELPASVPSQCTIPLPSVSLAMTAPFGQTYNLMQPISQYSSTLGKQNPYQAPLANQHPHFPSPSNSIQNSFLPPPPFPPPPHHFSAIATFRENGYPPQHTQQPLQPPWNGIPCTSTMDQTTDQPNCTQTNQYPAFSLPRENLSSLPGGSVTGERMTGYPMQGTNPSQSFSLAQPYSLMMNQPSYTHNYVNSRMSSHSIPYVSTFDLPPGSKFESNASVQENETTISSKYGSLVGSSSAPVGASVVSKNMVSSSSLLQDQSVLPRSGGDQYDPLYDSIEPTSTLFSGADRKKLETSGGSDNVKRLYGSERLPDMEIIKQEGGTALSTNDLVENEEFGETADVEIGDVLNGSLSSPNDGTNLNAGEIDIDQVEVSKKKMKGKDSLKLFKTSIASFVKEVLQPSWRQGNMSKEVFKTIVKKTVDKVSGAMKGHRVPKSQANINHYIDSSRGKLTKLVMGYVDKYVKV